LAAALLGLAAWTLGDLEAAHRSYAEGTASLHKAGHLSDVLGCSIALADIRIAQGRLHEARQTYEHTLQLVNRPGAPALRGTADMYAGLGELARERNDLPAATRYLLSSQALGEHKGLPQYPYRWRVAMARIRAAEGDLDGALGLLEEAEQRYTGDFSPNVRPVSAWTTRLWVTQGRLGEALGWVRAQGLSVDDDLSFLREFQHINPLVDAHLDAVEADQASRLFAALKDGVGTAYGSWKGMLHENVIRAISIRMAEPAERDWLLRKEEADGFWLVRPLAHQLEAYEQINLTMPEYMLILLASLNNLEGASLSSAR
jgi:LuxR family maltose regulon positive regulatory protein